MRLVLISDTHNQHGRVELPDGDVLIHAGDATGRGQVGEVSRFLDWFERQQQYKERVMIAGNHDFLFEKDPLLARAVTHNRDLIYLQDDYTEIDGVSFYGSPWQPWFNDWAFNLDPMSMDLKRVWEKIPDDIDVLITHGPPKNVLDHIPSEDAHPGCYDLWQRVQEVRPRLHVFGHIHESYGYLDINGILFVNASSCNARYEPVNKPIVVDWDGGEVSIVR